MTKPPPAPSPPSDKALLNAAKKAFAFPFNAVIKLTPDGATPISIDGRKNPPVISAKKHKADCEWRGAPEVLLRALESEGALESAYLLGQLKISGDMSVMTRLALANPQ